VRDITQADQFGIHLPHPLVQLNWRQVQARKRKILQQRSEAAVHKAVQLKPLDLVFGRAQLSGLRQALIEPHEQESREVGMNIQFIGAVTSVDRSMPIVLGLVLIALVFAGPQSLWGWVGLVMLLASLVVPDFWDQY